MRLPVCFILMLSFVAAHCNAASVSSLVASLDSILTSSGEFEKAKENRIEQLRKKESSHMKEEERLWLNKMLYDEYSVYKADSAMNYADKNIEIARHMGRPNLEQEWLINKVFLLAAQGLLSEAEKEIKHINVDAIADEDKYSYYETAIYLYTHLSQYIGHSNGMSEQYDSISNKLRKEALNYVTPTNPGYYCLKASMLSDPKDPEWATVKYKLHEAVDHGPLNNRTSAINAYTLAKMCEAEGDKDGHINYLIKSAIADTRMCNRDIASLEELANIFYQEGDIDRGYAYINHCLKAALLYPNRVRVVNISSVLDKLQRAAELRSIEQEHKLSNSLIVVSVLSGILVLGIIVMLLQFLKLKNSHKKLMESKALLNEHMQELSNIQKQLSSVNHELTDTNEKLRESNEKLIQSNYVKEEYVGYVFSICSGYLTKMEELRKNIGRKLKVGQIDDVKALLSSQQIEQNELRDFYHRFDTTFLHIYPRFVEDFNALLRPEERIVLKKGELLNTELRIYALVRLGINDSVKISEFLHMSPQTVYNNRLKVRNKAAVPKDEFVNLVQSLGKDQREHM